ncbi:mechanosensitive ion channel family protein [Synechococcus sp. OH20]|uniref:mechanosensitive ion channel family protein n=1 Tax=Synechococcus sp. OH20 TaxID=139337 RepID=UPI0039C62C77
MNELLQTINRSLLEMVGRGIELLPGFLIAAVILWATRYGVRAVRRLLGSAAGRWISSPSLQLLLVQIGQVGAWVVGILAASVVAFPDLRLGDLIGLLGLGSVAIGFAFQDIFKNFLAGVLLLLNEPFQLNNQIVVGDFEGTVEEISIRSTQIRTYQGERVVIPNAVVFTSPITVLTDRPFRRTDLEIRLDHNTPLPKALEVFRETMQGVEGVLAEPPFELDIVGFGDSSINCVVRYWTRPRKAEVRRVRTQVMIALKQACDRAGLVIPYPIRTVYLFDQQDFQDRIPTSRAA